MQPLLFCLNKKTLIYLFIFSFCFFGFLLTSQEVFACAPCTYDRDCGDIYNPDGTRAVSCYQGHCLSTQYPMPCDAAVAYCEADTYEDCSGSHYVESPPIVACRGSGARLWYLMCYVDERTSCMLDPSDYCTEAWISIPECTSGGYWSYNDYRYLPGDTGVPPVSVCDAGCEGCWNRILEHCLGQCDAPPSDDSDDIVVDPECDITRVGVDYGGMIHDCPAPPVEIPAGETFYLVYEYIGTGDPEPYETVWGDRTTVGVEPAVTENLWCDYSGDRTEGQLHVLEEAVQCPSGAADAQYLFGVGCRSFATSDPTNCWQRDDYAYCSVVCTGTGGFACTSLDLAPAASGTAPYTVTSYTPTITDTTGIDNWWIDYDYTGADAPCGDTAAHVWDNTGSGFPTPAALGSFTYPQGSYRPTLRILKGEDYACCSADLEVAPRPNQPPSPPVLEPRSSQADPQNSEARKTKLIGSGYKHFPSDRIIVRQPSKEPQPFSSIQRLSASLTQTLKLIFFSG